MTKHDKPPTTRPRPRPRGLLINLTDAERDKLEWLRANRGERATLASTVRELIMQARR